MSTNRMIIDALANAAAAEETVVLATVVKISGSSYGGVGTRMVVRADGSTIGLVSGGCLESDLAEHAREVRSTGVAKVVTYDTRGDDDSVWGLGLGCNGLIDVLVERLDPTEGNQFAALLERAITAGAPSVLATVIKAQGSPAVGARVLIAGDESETAGDWANGSVLTEVVARAGEARAAGRKGLTIELDSAEVACEVVNPTVTLVICGSGPDVVPFVHFATNVGWIVTVVEHRPVTAAHGDRFPGANVVECAETAQLGDVASLTPHAAAVVMSHHFERDTDYVEALARSGVAYIGVLGPSARTERMFAELTRRGVLAATDPRIFGPVGLDVGGDGPEAIALSIITEISAVLNQRTGGHLRNRKAPLH